MSYRHDELDDDLLDRPREREVTLSTGTILGIFFGLALLCGAFFGLGYNMGSKARTATVTTAEGPGPAANFNAFKPSSGSPAIQPVPGYLSPKEAEAANKAAANTAYNTPGTPAAGTTAASVTPRSSSNNVAPQPVRETEPPAPAAPIVRTPPPAPRPLPAAPESVASGSYMVQVAAVSHSEDADLLINALKRKGYAVASRTEPQDRLFHIQVGPFGTKKDADAMRQRLLGDGYNAILK